METITKLISILLVIFYYNLSAQHLEIMITDSLVYSDKKTHFMIKNSSENNFILPIIKNCNSSYYEPDELFFFLEREIIDYYSGKKVIEVLGTTFSYPSIIFPEKRKKNCKKYILIPAKTEIKSEFSLILRKTVDDNEYFYQISDSKYLLRLAYEAKKNDIEEYIKENKVELLKLKKQNYVLYKNVLVSNFVPLVIKK